MTDETRRWIEAGRTLATDAEAQVSCPRCGLTALVVTDASPPDDPTLIERHLRCPGCGAYNAIRLRRK